ncbi:MAG: ABC transporter substrate-binding protein [Thermoleophilaceae bacterium]|nr:ABC transporter substrate-binding protein [Thermoleophilaceae bacterium]
MSRTRLITIVSAGVVLVLAGFVGVVVATSGSSSDALVVYSARSHYGEEEPFRRFARDEDVDLTLFGGSASELYERIRSEGDEARADLLITVDAANLWRATRAGLLEPVRSAELERSVPADLRDPQGRWFGLTQRARTIMRSTERVGPEDATTYEDLGNPRWNDRLCLRSGTSEYNVSFVADRLAKDGEGPTEAMLRRWMANDPEILGSDTDVLDAIADGRCDVGLTNHYYLGRILSEQPDFPVAPVWADQDGRGTHVNLSGLGVVRRSERKAEAVGLIEFLSQAAEQQVLADNNYEFGVAAGVEPAEVLSRFGSFERDPIDVEGAGRNLDDALRLMDEVGWD